MTKNNISSESDSSMVICSSIIGLVVEFVVAIDEARVRFTDDAFFFVFFFFSHQSINWNVFLTMPFY